MKPIKVEKATQTRFKAKDTGAANTDHVTN